MRRVLREHPGLVDEVAAAGPGSRAGDRSPSSRRSSRTSSRGEREHWGWNWSNVKRALEYLFWAGEITSAGRDSTFRRRYAAPEQVIPRAVLGAPTPSEPRLSVSWS